MLNKLIQQLQNQEVPSSNIPEQELSADITLRFSISNEVTVNPENYQGKTISQLFHEYEDELGVDMSRASSYKDITTGSTVEGSSSVEPGHSYKVLIMTGTKG